MIRLLSNGGYEVPANDPESREPDPLALRSQNMKIKDIENLVVDQPDTCPFLAEVRKRHFPHKARLTMQDRLSIAPCDPAFGDHFVGAYIRAGKVLPDQVWWPSLWRAYCCKRFGDRLAYQDRDCLRALALHQPSNNCSQRVTQIAIKALACAGMGPTAIGQTLGMPATVVEIYLELFFDFTDRSDNQSFVMKVLNAKAELKMFKAEKMVHDPELLLMNIGYLLGPAVVLSQLGIKSVRDDSRPIGELLGNTKQQLFGVMEMKAKLGLLGVGDPGLSMARAVVAAEAKHQPDLVDDDARMGLTRLSMDQGAMLTFRRIVTAASEERMRNARIFDAQRAAEEVKRKASDGNAKPG
jgi:hypothetical protein